MESLRCMYELPYLGLFIKHEAAKFNFPRVDIRGLEEGLADPKSNLFADIVCRLLRHIKQNKDIRITCYESYLKSYLDETKSEFTQLTKTDLHTLQATEKVKLLKWLADQTKSKKDELDDFLNDDFSGGYDTVINVGQDSENRTYWYFDDLRLYRQKTGQPKTNCDWQCVATNSCEWKKLIEHFSKSTDDQDKELYTYLNEYIYAAIKSHLEPQDPVPLKPSNEELMNRENEEMEMKEKNTSDKKPQTPVLDPTELIKSENPELSKVLSEESTTGNGTKRSSAMPFTHQHSQLFVFTTGLANRAANAVMSGAHKSIISYHLEDPDTKQFLQANPMKITLPSQQPRLPMAPLRPTNPYRQPRGQWDGGVRPTMPPMNYNQPHMAGPMPNSSPMGGMNLMGQPDISHQQVPDEILTPEQRQHREDGLASLRKIHEMLMADGNGQPNTTDFKHINMAQDRQGPYVPPHSQSPMNTFGMNPQAGGANMYGGSPLSPTTALTPVEHKPPPPYPMPLPSPGTTGPKKPGRKRKNSSLPSPSPSSPLGQPSVKSEKQSIPPSPLANQHHQSGPMTPQGNPMTPQPCGPKTPQPINPDPNVGGMMPPIARQNSMPSFPGRNGGQPPTSYHMLQAGQPMPYHNTAMGSGNDAPPSYNVSLRRGMSVESITAPPSHRQQYLQPENQERPIERQLNMSHHSSVSYQSFGEQQTLYSSASHGPVSQTSSNDSNQSLTSITSASLANLAKGVEQNLSQMSQKMSQNGPFNDPPSSTVPPLHDQPNQPPLSSQAPSVNNTFVNAHMSIGQVNIQNVTASQSYQGPGMPNHMQQNVDVRMNNFNGGVMPQPQPEPIYKPPPQTPAVNIQTKGRSTIKYMPATQPALPPSHEPVIPPKQNFDFMSERYPSPSSNYFHGEPPMMAPQPSPHARHPGPMYTSQMSHHNGSSMMPGGPPSGMTMGEGIGPRPTGPHGYMMSAHHNSMSMGYSQGPLPAGHPGLMESHHMHIRNQQLVMQQAPASSMAAPPHSYGAPGNYGPPTGPPGPNMPPYHQPGGEYVPGSHHMPPRGPPMHQSMMMSHHTGPYMNNPGPPYM